MEYTYAQLHAALDRLTDAEMLALHREVARRAQRIRQTDPEWVARYEMGRAAAQSYTLQRRAGTA